MKKGTSGRPQRRDFGVYPDGRVRLPYGWLHTRDIIVRYELPDVLVIRPAADGEVGIRPYGARATYSPQVDMRRVFRRMGIDPQDIAGSYSPQSAPDGAIRVSLNSGSTV